MKKTMKYLSMAALAMVGAVISSCSSSSDFDETPAQPASTGNVETLTVTVGMDGGDTRALAADGTKTFAVDDKIAVVYKNTSGTTVKAESEALTAGDITDGSQSATFTVTLTDADKTKDVTYIYPAAMAKDDGTVNYEALNSQDGTLATLASDLDLATYTAAWDDASLPAGELANQLAILAITLKNNDGSNEITDDITGLTLSDGTNDYAVSRSAAAGPIYLAIRPTSSANIEITATDGTYRYAKWLTEKTYKENNGYNLSWRMMNLHTTPLTLEVLTDGNIVVNSPKSGMQYSLNGGTKTAVTSDAIGVNKGDKVQFYGKGTSITSYYGTKIYGGTAQVKAYGNIMSLVDENNFTTASTLSSTNVFRLLFSGNTTLTDASGLLLPATTLTEYCYQQMFQDCTNLTAAPALPAKTLANYCYQQMFLGCTSLTTAPVLPAPTLVSYCYASMFKDCTNLRSVTCHATSIGSYTNTSYWLNGVAATGTFTAANSTVGWSSGTSGIPSDWTRVNAQ